MRPLPTSVRQLPAARSLSYRVRETLASLRDVPLVLRMAWDCGRAFVVLGLTLRVVTALLPIGILAVAREIVATLSGPRETTGPRLLVWVALEVGLALALALIAHVVDHVDTALSERYTRHASLCVMRHAADLDLATYEDPGFQDVMDRARVQASDRVTLVFALARACQTLVTFGALVVAIGALAPLVIGLFLGCTLPSLLAEGACAMRGYELNRRLTPVRRELEYMRALGSSKDSAKELRVFGLKEFLIGQYTRLADIVYREKIGLSARLLVQRAIAASVMVGGLYAGYAIIVYRTWRGALTIADFVFMTGAIASAAATGRELFSALGTIADQSLYIRDLAHFLSVERSITAPAAPSAVPRPMKRGFEFLDVGFVYPGRTEPVLRSLSFTIAPGERLALVGGNGAGKTTIIKLMLRLYVPTTGRILLDGVDLSEFDPRDLASEVGVIFQDYVRYEMSARNNVAVGRIELREDLPAIVAAAKKSLADPVLQKLPDGYVQRLGRKFDGGVDLSGGEWQRVALARAYLRDAQLVVLDEPTAALDAKAEAEVFERFTELAEGRTTVLISHRFSTVRTASRIIVLDAGEIIESGTHEELLALGGMYATMFEVQAAGYR